MSPDKLEEVIEQYREALKAVPKPVVILTRIPSWFGRYNNVPMLGDELEIDINGNIIFGNQYINIPASHLKLK